MNLNTVSYFAAQMEYLLANNARRNVLVELYEVIALDLQEEATYLDSALDLDFHA